MNSILYILKRYKKFILLILLLCLCTIPVNAAGKKKKKNKTKNRKDRTFKVLEHTYHGGGTKILFIGNSYTKRIRDTFNSFIEASGKSAAISYICRGGASLDEHWKTKGTIDTIKKEKYDYVILQGQSQIPALPDYKQRFQDAAKRLNDAIYRSGGKTVFYMTWGRRDGDKTNPGIFPNYSSMQRKLTASYKYAAKRLSAKLAPVGTAWDYIRKGDKKLFLKLYSSDGSHPSEYGAYTATCIFYSVLFKEDPGKVNYNSGLSEEENKIILEAVKKVVK